MPNLQKHQTTKDTIARTPKCNTLDSNGKMLSMLSFNIVPNYVPSTHLQHNTRPSTKTKRSKSFGGKPLHNLV